MAKLTEAELRQIIREELEDIDEGFLDRFLAKAKGAGSKLGGMAKNVGQIGQAVAQGGDIGTLKAKPEVMKGIKMAASRVNGFSKKLDSLSIDFLSDMEALFGEGLVNAPDEVKKSLEDFSKKITSAKAHAVNLGKSLQSGKLFQRGQS
tara:strand:- start:13 stop:459 length:447 start_codon:yes stop_codon:yes gene_type:complete